MGFRFWSIPGVHPIRDGGRGRPIPPPEENPKLAGWMESRSPTSHGVLGLDPGMPVDLDLHGEHRPAMVVREEGDQKTGEASVFVRSAGSTGKSETHKITFKPDQARTMIQTDFPKRVRE